MAATKTVAHPLRVRKSSVAEILAANPHLGIAPRHGVVTLFGYGIQVRVDRGHLILEDGIGADRRYARFPRVGHGLQRLIVIGADGMVSLAALRWLTVDQNASFVMLDRAGSVLMATGPTRKGDVHIRRAQALARQSGAGIQITQDLIDKKLRGQEQVARNQLGDSAAADAIAKLRLEIPSLHAFDTIRLLESQAASFYWEAWRSVQIQFPRQDLPRVPDHWRTFKARRSPISGSPRLAANPVNAILNYLYAIVEAEARLAATILGLDPGLGFLHADTAHRDSLAADLMEPVRPQVDAFVLDWILREPIKREWFFEERDGNCRLMAPFAARLSETAQTWRRLLAPLAESVARVLWSKIPKRAAYKPMATSLTERRRREAKGGSLEAPKSSPPHPQHICRNCGGKVSLGSIYCYTCDIGRARERVIQAAKSGRVAAKRPKARAQRSATHKKHRANARSWDPQSLPVWLDKNKYERDVLPLLANVKRTAIASALGVSHSYATDIARGKHVPHPRHWVKLARIVGIQSGDLG
jgi:CRISPR-associated endonuclease Cas1